MKLTILVIEDNKIQGESLIELLREFDYRGILSNSAEEALKVMNDSDIDIILADVNLPGQDGLWFLEKVKETDSQIPVIMITGDASVDTAVLAIKKGAYDYLSKPIDVNRLQALLTGASRMRQLVMQNAILTETTPGKDAFSGLIGDSKNMTRLKEMITKVAPTPASVLILGESGTGKEPVANSIVSLSDRSNGPYVKVNSAALPRDTLESELFGHVKGAFTGAIKDRKGRFELAHGGTLFLDEVGEMPLATQVKLLRVLQEGEFERVGGSEVIKVDVRIIAATNRNLREQVEAGEFREDLYFRLNIVPIEVPPLRDRKDDILILFNHFMSAFCGKEPKKISEEALVALQKYRWPGNVRELRNITERLSIIVHGDEITKMDLPLEISNTKVDVGAAQPEVSGTMEEIERNAILQSLRQNNGIKSDAAKQLGIGLKTLYRKLEKYQEEGVDLSFLKENN